MGQKFNFHRCFGVLIDEDWLQILYLLTRLVLREEKVKEKKKTGYMMTWDFGFNLITLAFYISWTHNYFGKNWLILDKYNTTKLHQNYFLWASLPMRAKLRTVSSNSAVFHDVTELVLQFMKTWVSYSPSLVDIPNHEPDFRHRFKK